MVEISSSPRRGTLPWAAVAAVFGYAAVAALFAPFTWPMRVATGLPCAALALLVLRRGWHRPGARPPVGPSRTGRAWFVGIAGWVLLIAVAVTFQLMNFFAWPRDVYPTLSSLAAQVFPLYPVRAAAFGLWLWFGWYLVDR